MGTRQAPWVLSKILQPSTGSPGFRANQDQYLQGPIDVDHSFSFRYQHTTNIDHTKAREICYPCRGNLSSRQGKSDQ